MVRVLVILKHRKNLMFIPFDWEKLLEQGGDAGCLLQGEVQRPPRPLQLDKSRGPRLDLHQPLSAGVSLLRRREGLPRLGGAREATEGTRERCLPVQLLPHSLLRSDGAHLVWLRPGREDGKFVNDHG